MEPKKEKIKKNKRPNSELKLSSKLREQASAWDLKNEFTYNCDFSTEHKFPPATNCRHLKLNILLSEFYKNNFITSKI